VIRAGLDKSLPTLSSSTGRYQVRPVTCLYPTSTSAIIFTLHTSADPPIQFKMPSLSSDDETAVVTYLDEIDDEDVLRVVRKIRQRGNLPDYQVAEQRPRVMYSLDGEMIGTYRVEINTDAASTGVDIDSASAVAVPSTRPRRQKPKKKPDVGLPAPRYTFNESLQENMLEDFHLVRYNYEGESEPKKRIPSKKSPRRRRKLPRIIGSSPASPKRGQSQLGFNLFCGSGGLACSAADSQSASSKVRQQADEPDELPRSQLRRSMNSLRNEVGWLYDDMLGSGSDSETYGSEHESRSSTKKSKLGAGFTSLGLSRLWAGLGNKDADDDCSEDDSSGDDEDDYDYDDLRSELGSLTVASAESSKLTAEIVSPRGPQMGYSRSRRVFRA
jgi:hypothetical protein